MNILDALSLMSRADHAALGFLALAFWGIGWWIEHPGMRRPSVTVLMSDYRRRWMAVFLGRDNRIFDSQIMGSLRQGTAFFASTSLIGVGAVLALIGNPAPLEGVAEGLIGADMPEVLWQIRLMLVAGLLAHAFLKFVWANRLFGYCAVLMGATPEDGADPAAVERARIAGEINVRAALNFNRGLRSMYFALGALAWLIGPLGLAVATVVVAWVLWGREFVSAPQRLLAEAARAEVSGRSPLP